MAAAANVHKLYRAVIDDVLNGVRESFLDDGVDEQVLMDLKQMWERKISDTKAVDTNAREPEPVTQTKHSNRNNAGGRNAAANKEAAAAAAAAQSAAAPSAAAQPTPAVPMVTQAAQQPSQTLAHVTANATQMHPPLQPPPTTTTTVLSNNHHPIQVNHPTAGQHHVLQAGTNIVLGPSGINYTTSTDNTGQSTGATGPKMMLVQSPNGPYLVSSGGGGPINISQDFLNHLQGFQSSSVIQQSQPSVLHHTSNVNLAPNTTIQYAASATAANPARPTLQTGPRPPATAANRVVQLDGANDTSDEDDDEDDYRDRDDDDHEDNDEEINDDDNDGQGEDEEPLNSGDDVSDEDPTELFETDNVVVCQYDKITRSRNKWKFHLKDGIMNLQGKDYVFQKAVGDAEW